jgi:hypothetical protein
VPPCRASSPPRARGFVGWRGRRAVEGAITLNGKPVAAAHVLAKLHDNAEGVVTRTLLVAVTDRPLPPGGLDGIGETVASQLALAGKLRGVLFRIDPARPDEAALIVLDKPEQQAAA